MTTSHKFTRRRFLAAAVAGPVVIGRGLEVQAGRAARPPVAAALDARQRASLLAAMDEIIPAGDGMPSASAAGGLQYLEGLSRQESGIALDLRQAIEALRQWSENRFHAPFATLSPAARVEGLTTLEAQSPLVFAKLRDLVYESYYTQPVVWKLIGYELHPANGAGPRMKPFDEAVLAKVRAMPKLYREVSEG